GEPRTRTVVIGPLNPVTVTRPSRLGRSGVAHEHELGCQAEGPRGDTGLKMRNLDGSNANFGALCPNERRDAIDGISGRGLDGDRRPARSVAVKAEAGADVDPRAADGADDDATLGARETRACDATVHRLARIDAEPIAVSPDAGESPEPGRPLDLVLPIDAGAGLYDTVFADRVQLPTRVRVKEADGRNVIVPDLKTARVLRTATGPRCQWAMTELRTAHEAMIRLLELIAVYWIVQEEGEVREQVEVVSDAVRGQLCRSIPARSLPLERATVSVCV